jgi:2-polyprenyl-3-methyl-5-hydroxy-6-metoxy-1,4-benzoquinol methylase
MSINTKYRTDTPEIMDDFTLEGEVLREALDKIAKINQFLGGNSLTLNGVKELILTVPKSRLITIVDVGCGNGDLLRVLSNYGKENNYSFSLIGIDANAFTVNHAKKLSESYSNINFQCEDIFEFDFSQLKCDIILCTLTLHHFKNEEIESLLTTFYANSNLGIVINDLHRSSLAYRLFQIICFLFQLNSMSREDGLTSILRGFKKEELETFSKKLGFKKYKIQWKWAFRYQWIIQK